jgi:hypothetical protein
MPNAVDAGAVDRPRVFVQTSTATQHSETFTSPAPPNSAATRRHFEPPSTYALDIDVIDADSIRTIVEHRAERPVELFSLDGRPHRVRSVADRLRRF